VAPVECVRLRFVPVQPMAPLFPGPYLLHLPSGYENGSKHLIERGMGFAAAATCPGGSDVARQFLELRLALSGMVKPQFLAQLSAGDTPVLLPEVPSAATLQVRTYRSDDCVKIICPPPKLLATRHYELTIVPRRSLCTAQYASTTFDVNDQDLADFRVATVTGISAGLPFGTNLVFEADGRVADGSNALTTVGVGESFAIHVHDFYPVHPPLWPGDLLAGPASGATHAAGLAWPRVRGNNAGSAFQFSCDLPEVVRDVVNFGCQGGIDALYRMPFGAGDTGWSISQGAQCGICETTGCPNHCTSWAWDFAAPCGAELRAPRSGRVAFLVADNSCENFNCSSFPPVCGSTCCPACCRNVPPDCPNTPEGLLPECYGNYVRIRHQDGSRAQAAHIAPGGVLVEVGDLVRRGQLIGLIGRTGNATGPHTHWSSFPPGGKALFSLFEAQNPEGGEGDLLTCYEPMRQDVLRSNNPPID